MKQKVMFLAVILIMMPVLAFSQARVTNAGAGKVELSSPDDTKSTVILPGGTVFISWFPQNGEAQYKLSLYNGETKLPANQLTGLVSDGKLIVNGQGSTGSSVSKQSTYQVANKTAQATNAKPQTVASKQTVENTADSLARTSLVLHNASDFRLTVLGAPFQGAALKAGQTSKKSVILSTGEYVFPVYYDSELDSTSTGRQYKWSVVDKIVVEDQDTFFIRNEDLKEMALGSIIKRSLRNNLAIDFLIMSGANKGKVIAAKTASEKLTLNIGWNVIPVQYKDDNGLPVQAVLLLLASDYGRLSADEKSGKEVTIERNNIIFTTR